MRTLAKILGYGLVLLLVAAAIGFTYKYTNGFNEDLKYHITNRTSQEEIMSNRQFKWQDRYEIGVEIIDREHKKLFSIMNKLLAYSDDESKGQWVCQEGIKYFIHSAQLSTFSSFSSLDNIAFST